MKKTILIMIFCALVLSLASCGKDTETLKADETMSETTTVSETSSESTETISAVITTTTVTSAETILTTTSALTEKPITTPAPVAPVTTVKPVTEATSAVTPTPTVTTTSAVTTASEVTTLTTIMPTSTVTTVSEITALTTIMPTSTATTVSAVTPPELKDKEVALPKSIKDLADKQNFESEIAVYNFKTKEFYYYNADKMIYSASIQKLPYSYFCYDKIEDGAAKLSDTKVFLEKFRRGGLAFSRQRKAVLLGHLNNCFTIQFNVVTIRAI